MKKFVSLALALVLVLALSVTTFAAAGSASAEELGNAATFDVYAAYNLSAIGDVISVEVSWTDPSFTYNATQSWDETEHEVTTSGSWAENSGVTITVVNNSNIAINASASFAASEGYETVTMATVSEENIAVGATEALTMAIGGNMPVAAQSANSAKIGTITVAIAKYVTES